MVRYGTTKEIEDTFAALKPYLNEWGRLPQNAPTEAKKLQAKLKELLAE